MKMVLRDRDVEELEAWEQSGTSWKYKSRHAYNLT